MLKNRAKKPISVHLTESQQVALSGFGKLLLQGLIPTISCMNIEFERISPADRIVWKEKTDNFRRVNFIGINSVREFTVRIIVVKEDGKWRCFESGISEPKEKGRKISLFRWEEENWVFRPDLSSK